MRGFEAAGALQEDDRSAATKQGGTSCNSWSRVGLLPALQSMARCLKERSLDAARRGSIQPTSRVALFGFLTSGSLDQKLLRGV